MDTETIDQLLTTTRSVRKRLNLGRPVEREIVLECVDIAIQAPTGANLSRYHFLIVDDAAKREQLAEWYGRAFDKIYTPEMVEKFTIQMPKSYSSFRYLADHIHEVPMLVFAFVEGRPEGRDPMGLAGLYGSIQPAAWSLMLALRSRGIGSAWTTLNVGYEPELKSLLNIPDNVTVGAVLPIAYYTGDGFRKANRPPAKERTYWNGWGESLSN